MNVRIVAVGKIREKFVDLGLKEYGKRIGRYGRLEIVEVKEESFSEPLSDKEKGEILRREGERIWPPLSRFLCFCPDRLGELWSSERLAAEFQRQAVQASASWFLSLAAPGT